MFEHSLIDGRLTHLPNTEPEKPALLLDLGGVLADIANPAEQMQLNISNEEFWSIWLTSANVKAFEVADIDERTFCSRMAMEFGLSHDEFNVDRFRQWTITLFPQTENVIRWLAPRYHLYLLSNTNTTHWDQVTSTTDAFTRFRQNYLSFEIGLSKPSAGIYDYVVNDINRPASDILFLDDSATNVKAALDAGLRSRLTLGIDHVREIAENELRNMIAG